MGDVQYEVDHVAVRDRGDHVEVTGLSAADLGEAVELYVAARARQRVSSQEFRHRLLASMADANIPLVAAETQAQAQRAAALKEELLSHPCMTVGDLGVLRGSTDGATRTWITRQRSRHRLITVLVEGRSLIPAIQLGADGSLRPEIVALVEPLLAAGLDPWSTWAWLVFPTDALSGEIPAEVAGRDVSRARRAAVRSARQVEDARSRG